jgi:hypothetical protein
MQVVAPPRLMTFKRHHWFDKACRDLLKLRLKTAEAYVKVLTGESGAGSASDKANFQVSLAVTIIGLGPDFQVVAKVGVPHCC